MLRYILRAEPYLPAFLSASARLTFWKVFWLFEALRHHRELGGYVSLRGSERAVLAEAIGKSYPFATLLEIGCGFGQNFHVIAKLFPDAVLVGVDRDAVRVESGNQLLRERGFRNVSLVRSRAEDLDWCADGSFDVVITCAALLYVDPHSIRDVIREMLRVCRRKILFVEPTLATSVEPTDLLGRELRRSDGSVYWVRDYAGLVRTLAPNVRTSGVRVWNPRFTAERWDELGWLTECAVDKYP